MAQIRSSNAASSDMATPTHDATTSAVRSSAVGPSPPLVMISVDAETGEEVERGAQILRPVADHDRVRQDHAARPQLLGQPRPVGVCDQAAEHLRAGHHDPGADAHVAQSPVRTDSASRRGRLPGRSS